MPHSTNIFTLASGTNKIDWNAALQQEQKGKFRLAPHFSKKLSDTALWYGISDLCELVNYVVL